MKRTKKSRSLRSLIYLSSGLLVGVCCIASGIGWFGQAALLSNIREYEKSELVASNVLEIDRNVQELKAHSENYIHSGTESTRRSADQLLRKLLAQVADTRTISGEAELDDPLDEMERHLRTFGQQLQLAAQERGIRTSLVSEQLPKKSEQVRDAIKDLKEEIDSREHDSAAKLLEVIEAFGEGREHLLRYLIDPGADQLDIMLVDIERAQNHASMLAKDASPKTQQLAENLLEKLMEFRQLSLRAVQATRGYLYYSHVVMAGEISEFVYYSNQVKTLVDKQQQRNRHARAVSANRTRTLSVIASLAALVFAVLLATGLSYSIIRPISRLTDAFRRLAGGATLEDIPGTDRSDEIGRMSQAAQVFSAKNQETQDLLAQSQSLSSELTEKAKALEETNLELDNFAYVASHDLKAPLRGIKSLAQWVNEDCESLLPDDSKRHLEQMQDRVEKMNSLLDDLLEYSRVGRIERQTERVDLQEMVRSIMDLADNPKGVQISIPHPLPKIQTVAAPLQQVLLNLITNAIKYNDKGDDGTIEIRSEDLGDQIRISVVDNGMGIAPRYHERVFQMYQRLSPREIEGSGMGLAIVRKQVEYHGGCMTLDSTLGNGCTFAFTWPSEACSTKEGIDMKQKTEFANVGGASEHV